MDIFKLIMKKIIVNIIQAALFLFPIIGVTGAKAQHKEVQLTKFDKNQVTVTSENVKVFLNIDTVQPLSDQGIKFSIKLKNLSNDDIKIYNVLDLLGFYLMDESGKIVGIPHVSKFLSNTNSYKYEAFIVEQIRDNGKRENLKMENEKFIDIKNGGTFEITLRIPKIQGGDGTNFYSKSRVSLPKGKYSFKLGLTLIEMKNGVNGSPESLDLPPVTFSYGN
ncbi:hypothetical protein Mucpa_6297 [Mucilaginibacter paludis DSM 18603]|uniref:Uncharacterized protein n=2 Tax=Mucilaginibacter TaxID=423349 RepID=H1Y3U1_9SPHI|nr:hypothetical protein Mucpa_6297 [Mucilaginibacter paludis DSM 18603]